jgi:hypothetical protein
MRTRSVWFVAVLLAACDHSAPFRPGAHGSDQPLNPGVVARLTLSSGEDVLPAWRPGGAGIVYTAERLDRADRDRCLAFLPPTGGRIIRYSCRTTAADDSLNVFYEAAPGPDGRIAYVRASNDPFVANIGPDAHEFVVGPSDNPNNARVLHRLPVTAPWGRVYDALSHIVWIGPDRLVALGERVRYPRPCMFCARDTVKTGVDIMIEDIAAAVPVLSLVAGTDNASSVAANTTGDTIYFTRNGESGVYRLALLSGQTDTIHDFGAAGIARDVAVANGRLAAVVGGAVSDSLDPFLGELQTDRGGPLYVVTLATGVAMAIGDPTWRFRRPALSPDGTRIVVAASDTVGAADIWLFQLP